MDRLPDNPTILTNVLDTFHEKFVQNDVKIRSLAAADPKTVMLQLL